MTSEGNFQLRSGTSGATPGIAGQRREMERGDDGGWRYAGTTISVPGATDITLAEILTVREVSRAGQAPEAVLISSAEVDENPALGWVRRYGRRLQAPDGDEFEVPWAVWEEHGTEPVGVRAPEIDGDGLQRLMALEERELRFARRAVELHSERRARLIAIASAFGMTRREVSDLVGLSPGRVQQVIDESAPGIRLDVERFLRQALEMLREIGPRVVRREQVANTPDEHNLLDELLAYGLLSEDDGAVRQTEAGERVEIRLRTRKSKDG